MIFAQAKEKKVKDAQEYEMFKAATDQAADANKRLAALQAWKEKYPESDYKAERLNLILTAYQQLGNAQKMWDTANEMLANDPKDLAALYWLTLLVESLPVTPDTLATGEKAAQGLLSSEKPASITDDAKWQATKKETTVIAHKALGFVATTRKEPKKAEESYRKALELNPNFAQVSYSLGMAIYQQKDPDRQSEVLFHFARAASLAGVGAFPDAQKKPVDAFFVKAYNSYHGSSEGLDEVRKAAIASAMPPAGFKIKSKSEVDQEKSQARAAANPALALWETIREALLAPDGETYFNEKVKGADLPGGVNGVTKFKGKVISQKPEKAPKEIELAVGEGTVADCKLVLATALPNPAEPGTEIEFSGIPSAIQKDPFKLTFDIAERKDINGWPAPPKRAPAARPVRRAPAAKKK
ncbi:MAG: hypothetical protein ACKV22_01095 [Bryobacteraceae bacterium]